MKLQEPRCPRPRDEKKRKDTLHVSPPASNDVRYANKQTLVIRREFLRSRYRHTQAIMQLPQPVRSLVEEDVY